MGGGPLDHNPISLTSNMKYKSIPKFSSFASLWLWDAIKERNTHTHALFLSGILRVSEL